MSVIGLFLFGTVAAAEKLQNDAVTDSREASLSVSDDQPSQVMRYTEIETTSPFDFCAEDTETACCEGKCSRKRWFWQQPWSYWHEHYGAFMADYPVLFKPLMADPRQVIYSVGWRFNDSIIEKNVIDISFGDTLPVYRFWNVCLYGDALQIDLEGALWAVFDPLHFSAPLINADYYVGLPVSYAYGCFSCRLRFYHISSHIGDEFLLNHPDFNRLNPSAETLELILSYQLTPDWRIYGGYGHILHSDDSFKCKRHYVQWGAEVYLPMGRYFWKRQCLTIKPFFAMNFYYAQDNNLEEDATYNLGYEFSKYGDCYKKLRLFIEYHKGFSREGQFCRARTQYFGIRGSYGY